MSFFLPSKFIYIVVCWCKGFMHELTSTGHKDSNFTSSISENDGGFILISGIGWWSCNQFLLGGPLCLFMAPLMSRITLMNPVARLSPHPGIIRHDYQSLASSTHTNYVSIATSVRAMKNPLPGPTYLCWQNTQTTFNYADGRVLLSA